MASFCNRRKPFTKSACGTGAYSLKILSSNDKSSQAEHLLMVAPISQALEAETWPLNRNAVAVHEERLVMNLSRRTNLHAPWDPSWAAMA